ncbi:MAG TPA: ATP-binding protein, partial [Euryarchaeota archaeon]|nr:ATP-binding protein [Euryarchaeota archaeon]
MNKIKHKIMVMSGKGGVGKTTVAVNLALTLSIKGYEVGLLDADIHGPNTPKMLGIENEKPEVVDSNIIPVSVLNLKVMSMAFLLPNTDSPVIWRGPLKMKAISQFANDVAWGKLDYII